MGVMEAYGLTRLPNAIVREPTPAAEADIARFHAREYLDVLKDADSGLEPSLGCAFGLGAGDNPVFPGLWQAARLVAAGSMLAADMVGSGQVQRAFHFAGGLHHAMRERASGFCYVNDAVLAVLTLRARGLRVAYIDIDAHHGDACRRRSIRCEPRRDDGLHPRAWRGGSFPEPASWPSAERARASLSVNCPWRRTPTLRVPAAFDAVVPPSCAPQARS